MTLQELWRDYRDKVYPGPEPMPADQNRELHQAFFAGAYALGQVCGKAGYVAAADEATVLYSEAEAYCRAVSQGREGG